MYIFIPYPTGVAIPKNFFYPERKYTQTITPMNDAV